MKKNVDDVLINKEIKTPIVRIVGNINPTNEIAKDLAIKYANDMGKDLILLSVTKDGVGICKIMEYSKYLYEKGQIEKKNLQNNKKTKIKEIRMTYNTGEHDFKFKLNHAIEFLKDGDKVKVFIFFAGREINFKDIGQLLLLKFINELQAFGKVENMPKLEGNRMWAIIQPKK
jgi:translation initiation factor IF-3